MKLLVLAIFFTSIFQAFRSLETLPHLSFLESGFDGLDYNKIENTKFKIFDLTDNANTIKMNGDSYLSSKYAQYTSIEKRVENSTVGVFTHYEEFLHKLTEEHHISVGIDAGKIKAGMKYSKEMEKIYKSIKDEKKAAGLSVDERIMYSVTLGPPFIIPLDSIFKMSLEALKKIKTPKLPTDQSIYNMFLQTYGTHYVSNIKIGAKFSLVTLIDSSFTSQFSSEKIKEQMSFGFSYEKDKLGFNSTSEHYDYMEHIMKEFESSSKKIGIYIPERQSENMKGNEWIKSAYKNPGIVGLEAHPLYDLLNVLGYKESGTHLKKTIDYYFKTGKYPKDANMRPITLGASSSDNLPWIPGIDKVGCGFDITTLESKHCLYELEEASDIWTLPLNKSISYKVPKGYFVMNNPQFISTNSSFKYDKVEHLIEESLTTINEDNDGFLGVGASHKTTSIYHYYEYFYQRNFHVLLSILELTYYSLYTPLFPKNNFNYITKLALESLPEKYDKLKYSYFIEAYGTHVMIRANMGGGVSGENWYDRCLEQHYSEDWIRSQSSKSGLFGLFGNKDSYYDHKQTRSELFAKYSTTTISILGGKTDIPEDHWSSWISTIKDNLQPTRKTLIPIWKILPEGRKRENLKRAVSEYRNVLNDHMQKQISEYKILSVPSPICKDKFQIINLLDISQNVTSTHVDAVRRFKEKFKQIFEESKTEVCPLIGFHGVHCKSIVKKDAENKFLNFLDSNTLIEADELFTRSIGLTYSSISGQTRTQVLNFTYDTDHTHTYSDIRTNTNYKMPLELMVNNIDAISYNSFLLEFEPQNYYDIKDNALKKSHSMLGGSFAEEMSWFEVYQKYFAGQYKSVLSQQYFSYFRVSYQSPVKLNRYAEEVLNLLPKNYTDDYLDFLEYWGDVISIDAEIGGMRELTLSYSDCSAISNDKMVLECKDELVGKFTGSKTYKVRSERNIGGNPEYGKDLNKWKHSILTNPSIVKVNKVYRWTDIVKDPVLKSNFVKAYAEFEKRNTDRIRNGINEFRDKLSSLGVSRNMKLIYQIDGEAPITYTQVIQYSSGNPFKGARRSYPPFPATLKPYVSLAYIKNVSSEYYRLSCDYYSTLFKRGHHVQPQLKATNKNFGLDISLSTSPCNLQTCIDIGQSDAQRNQLLVPESCSTKYSYSIVYNFCISIGTGISYFPYTSIGKKGYTLNLTCELE